MIRGFEKQFWRTAKYFFIFIFLPIMCRTYDPLKNLKQDDFGIVNKGKYRGTTIFLRDNGQYKQDIDILRSEIRKNHDLLPKITRLHYHVPETLVYEFKFAAFDSLMNNFILRYFARVYDHPTIAGYQIQFVFNADSGELLCVFTSEVALE
jgi:hypothetical protein